MAATRAEDQERPAGPAPGEFHQCGVSMQPCGREKDLEVLKGDCFDKLAVNRQDNKPCVIESCWLMTVHYIRHRHIIRGEIQLITKYQPETFGNMCAKDGGMLQQMPRLASTSDPEKGVGRNVSLDISCGF